MKTTHLLVFPLLYSFQLTVALPSSYSPALKPLRGHELDSRYLGRATTRDLFGRVDDPNACTTDSCKACDKCDPHRCRARHYRDKSDCKCKKCPTGMKPDPFRTACIPEKPGNDNDKKPDQKKESKWEETKKRMKERWEKKQQEKKDKEKKDKEKEDKEKKEQEEKEKEAKKDRKKERMGKCLPLVSLSMGYPEDGFPYANDFFSEEYIDSEDVMKHWPSELDDVPSGNIDTDEYVNDFLKAMDDLTWVPWGGGGGKKKRLATRSAPKISPSTEVAVLQRETGVTNYHEKRFVKALFTALKSFFARAGAWLAKKANRLQSLKEKGGLRVAEKGKGAKYADQKKAADNISKDKNWKNCINGKKPEKNGPG